MAALMEGGGKAQSTLRKEANRPQQQGNLSQMSSTCSYYQLLFLQAAPREQL